MTGGFDKKSEASRNKPRMSPCPGEALLAIGKALDTGERKYGHMDWRNHEVLASTYYNAVMRHLLRWWDGQDKDPESGLMPLAHAAAGIIILIDGIQTGNFVDDRAPAGESQTRPETSSGMSVGDMPTPTHMKGEMK